MKAVYDSPAVKTHTAKIISMAATPAGNNVHKNHDGASATVIKIASHSMELNKRYSFDDNGGGYHGL